MPRNRRLRDYLMRRAGRQMRRMGGRDMGMHERYEVPMHRDYAYEHEMEDGRRRRNAKGQYMADRGYEHEMMDGHYGAEGKTYYPIEAMGTFNGYWGMPEQDYGRYDMRGRRDMRYDGNYPYPMMDYGDYGETLTKQELEHWNKKMLKEVDEKYKGFFTKENITQKARSLGIPMEGFSEDELLTSVLMVYTDYCDALKPYIGENMDAYVKMGKSFLLDKDSAVKGGMKLALYHDEVVMAEEDD